MSIYKTPILIPYLDEKKKSFFHQLKDASQKRNINPLLVIYRKLRNNLLFKLTFLINKNHIRIKLHRLRGVNIGKNVYIGKDCIIDNSYPDYIYIEDNVAIASGTSIMAHANPYSHFRNVIESKVEPIVIKKGTWIGINSTILRGVTIGEYSIVGAGTVVDQNIPPYTIAKGNPMKKIINIESLMQNK